MVLDNFFCITRFSMDIWSTHSHGSRNTPLLTSLCFPSLSTPSLTPLSFSYSSSTYLPRPNSFLASDQLSVVKCHMLHHMIFSPKTMLAYSWTMIAWTREQFHRCKWWMCFHMALDIDFSLCAVGTAWCKAEKWVVIFR